MHSVFVEKNIMSGGLLYEKAVIIIAKNDPKYISMFALLRISSHTHVYSVGS